VYDENRTASVTHLSHVFPERETKRGQSIVWLGAAGGNVVPYNFLLARHLATILHVRQARVCASRHTKHDAFCQMRHSLHDAAMERAARSEL
jgi:hypothetical protein